MPPRRARRRLGVGRPQSRIYCHCATGNGGAHARLSVFSSMVYGLWVACGRVASASAPLGHRDCCEGGARSIAETITIVFQDAGDEPLQADAVTAGRGEVEVG
eukprot:scaffold189810_cov28-Tisochrysis_lutea.AAC.3